MKRFVCLVLSLILVFSVTATKISALSADTQQTNIVCVPTGEPVAMGEVNNFVPSGSSFTPSAASEPEPDYRYGLTASQFATVKQIIKEAVKNNVEVVDVTNYKIPYNSQTNTMLFNLGMYDPEHFNLKTYTYNYYTGSQTLANLYFWYSLDNETYKAQLSACDMAAEEMLKGLRDSSVSNYSRALILHDRLATWTEYDYEGIEISKEWTYPCYTMYGAFVKKKSVCQGYSMAYKYMLNKLGIPNYFCQSGALNHVWNIIYLNNKKYHVDVTWDDPSYIDSSSGKHVRVEGMVKHDNFLLSSTGIRNSGHKASDYDTSPNDTYFDDFWWKASYSEFVLLNGNIYFLYNKDKRGNTQLYRCDTALNNHTYIKKYNETWYEPYYSPTWSYYDSFSRLDTDGTNLFVSGDKEIYQYNPATGTQKNLISYMSDNIHGFKYENDRFSVTTMRKKVENNGDYNNTYVSSTKGLGSEGLIYRDGYWKYYKDNAFKKHWGIVYHNGNWYYVNAGNVDFTVTSITQYNGNLFYLSNGKADFTPYTWWPIGTTWCYVGRWGNVIANEWIEDSKGWCYAGADGLLLQNKWLPENGTWYYLDSSCHMAVNTWVKDSAGWVYLGSDGSMVTNCWVRDSVGWCYVGPNGYAVTNCWMKDSYGWCYLDSNGSMTKSKWVLDGGRWFYLNANGYMVANSWVKDSRGWCYLGSDGAMVTNTWVRDSKGWCYVGANGYAVTNCWMKDSYGWCYMDSQGSMLKSSWLQQGGKKYYLNSSGYMVTGRVKIGGRYYRFNSNGVLIS